MDSIGSQLQAAREERALVIDDVEFETRIPASHIRDIEADEYSNFASLTYARSFLKLYSDYLQVDTSAFQSEFPKAELGSVEDYPYLQEPTESLRPTADAPSPNAKSTKKSSNPAPTTPKKAAPAKAAGPIARHKRDDANKVPHRPHPVLLVGLSTILLGLVALVFFANRDRANAAGKPLTEAEQKQREHIEAMQRIEKGEPIQETASATTIDANAETPDPLPTNTQDPPEESTEPTPPDTASPEDVLATGNPAPAEPPPPETTESTPASTPEEENIPRAVPVTG